MKGTLSINGSFCVNTENSDYVAEFLDDMKELLVEWQDKIQVSTLTISVHDHRTLEEINKFSEQSEAKRWNEHGEAIAVHKGEKEED